MEIIKGQFIYCPFIIRIQFLFHQHHFLVVANPLLYALTKYIPLTVSDTFQVSYIYLNL